MQALRSHGLFWNLGPSYPWALAHTVALWTCFSPAMCGHNKRASIKSSLKRAYKTLRHGKYKKWTNMIYGAYGDVY